MKRFLLLLKLEYEGMFFPLCIIVAVMAALQLLLFGRRLRSALGFESLAYFVETGSTAIVFAVMFAALLALIGARLAMNYTPSKSIYALLTLPVGRRQVYLAKLAAALLAGFVLIAAQMVLLLIFYYFTARQDAGFYGEFGLGIPHGDLYLSLLRASFLRILFPPELLSLAFSLSGFFGTICMILYVAAKLKSGSKLFAVIVPAVWLALLLIAFPLYENGPGFNIVILALLVAVPVAVSIKGIKLFETGEVAG